MNSGLPRRRLWAASALWLAFLSSAGAATFTVTNASNSGLGSLRQAITDANGNPGLDAIDFNLAGGGPFTITLATALPNIVEPVVLDAATQPGYAGKPLVALNGAAVTTASGLSLTSSNSTVRGLAIHNFGKYGIEISGGGSNIVRACFLGADHTNGTAKLPNASGGLHVNLSSANLIGGTNAGEGNLISGNFNDGIFIEGSSVVATSDYNVVAGNIIGLAWGGSNLLANAKQGVRVTLGANNVIGGTTSAARNLISGNGENGVAIEGISATNNLVQGNYIGLDVTGGTLLGNTNSGVRITTGAKNNLVGGTNSGAGNVISGNRKLGVDINGGARDNVIQGNLIGTTAGGSSAAGNFQFGVGLSSTTNNLIGGTEAAARNVISANGSDGVGLVDSGARSNRIEGNYIGVNSAGNARLGNAKAGLWLTNASFNIIGSASAGGGNVISGNGLHGIYLVGTGCASNQVLGNLVGTDAAGTNGLGNGAAYYGITLERAPANQIGGTLPEMRNVVSSNNTGIWIGGTGASNNVIQGNYVGTDITGTKKIGNQKDGISVGRPISAGEIPVNNTIGGAVAGAGNVICANGSNNWLAGIYVGAAVGTVIQGNLIGVAADGVSPLGNIGHAVELDQVTNTLVGGTSPAAWNVIANTVDSVRSGVRVRSGSGNLIQGNSIYSNGNLGICFSGFLASTNDACDSDIGANNLQNSPTLTNAVGGATTTVVKGLLNSAAGQTYQLQFYANPAPDNTGYGEGRLYLGTASLAAAACTNAFSFTLTNGAPPGWFVTATATDAANNTSEFSPATPIMPPPPPTLVVGPVTNSVMTVSWLVTNAGGGSWQLISASNLASPVVWVPIPDVPVVLSNGTWFQVTQGTTNPAQFYRLQFQ